MDSKTKILLVAVNASYSHTNLAVRSIKYYIEKRLENIAVDFCEFTINQPVGEILKGIAVSNASVVLFSTYIWNAEVICKIIPDIKKILPEAVIGAGGPEFGYWPKGYLEKLKDLDFVVCGEGEAVCLEIAQKITEKSISELKEGGLKIQGVYFRQGEQIVSGGGREPICDLSELPFSYPELKFLNTADADVSIVDNKIFYYESNRGCPFSCSYCMSSLDRKVRFMPLERVFADLQIFLDAKVRLVKFVDRTFNLNEERYLKIWDFILTHHNGKTMFHFEIEAEYLSQKVLDFLQKVPACVMQFEIGVQSSNQKTLEAISRSPNVQALAENVRQIPRTIHQHLDLIAGLPYENLESFGTSYDFVMNLRPDALQLGFLKVLHGTKMEEYAEQNGWKWMENPAYETFSTPYMTYEDMLFLKDVEILTDAFYNSGKFSSLMKYVLDCTSAWEFFCDLVNFGRKEGVFEALRKEQYWFEFFAKVINLIDETKKSEEIKKSVNFNSFENLNSTVLYELLRYDFVKQGKKGNFPKWYIHNYNKDEHRRLLEINGGVTNARLDFAYSEYEEFSCHPESEKPELLPEGEVFKMLIKYERHC